MKKLTLSSMLKTLEKEIHKGRQITTVHSFIENDGFVYKATIKKLGRPEKLQSFVGKN